MSYVTYTAKRRIISGHVIDTSYSIEFDSSALNKRLELAGNSSSSLDGTTEGVINRASDKWAVTTVIFNEASLPQWEEFVASVAAAETFTFDAYGTVASPDNPETVILEGQPSIIRMDKSLKYQIAFNIRVL